jgi:hypothetical protein
MHLRYPPRVNIFTKRNAFIGFLTLKAISRKRKGMIPGRKKRKGLKLPLLLVLGIASAGVLAVLVALMLRRQREPEQIEGYVVAGGPERFDAPIAEQAPSQAA